MIFEVMTYDGEPGYTIIVYDNDGECVDELTCDRSDYILPFVEGYLCGADRDGEDSVLKMEGFVDKHIPASVE